MRGSIGFVTFLSVCWVNSAFVIAPLNAGAKKTDMVRFAKDSRRGFLETSSVAVFGIFQQGIAPAIAIDDLSMPTEAEQEAQSVCASSINSCIASSLARWRKGKNSSMLRIAITALRSSRLWLFV